MPKYLIHSCPKRRWYVDNYLIPSMQEQGIPADDIMIYDDKAKLGNLAAFIDSCYRLLEVVGTDGGTWHLQDDVLICSDFKQRTEELDTHNVVCGFTCHYDEFHPTAGLQPMKNLWWSFPCIRIPNKDLQEFLDWVKVWVWRDHQFDFCTKQNKGDDYIWKVWVTSFRANQMMYGCLPTLVEHVDYLIGGSEANPQRSASVNTRSWDWQEEDLVCELERRLKNDIRKRQSRHKKSGPL